MTSEEITVICTMMRTLDGMWLRIRLMMRFEQAATAVSAMPMVSAVGSLEVTANAEQMPSTCRMTGLLRASGSVRMAVFFMVCVLSALRLLLAQTLEQRAVAQRPQPVVD